MSKIKRALAAMLALVLVLAVGPQAMAAEAGTYAQEQGLDFTQETEFTAPFLAFVRVDGKYTESVEGVYLVPVGDGTYRIDSVTLSGPDEDGMVTLDITASGTGASVWGWKIGVEYTDVTVGGAWRYDRFFFFDYYTGERIPMESDMTTSSEVAVDGDPVPIETTLSWEHTSYRDDALTSYNKYNYYETMNYWQCTYGYTVRYPAGYDGLCLALFKPGITEYIVYEESEEEEPEVRLLIEEDETGDDYYCIRVTDLVAAFGSEG